jgi:hypothetical protein
MLSSSVIDMKAFVPAKDPAISKAFYTDLGFTINWSNDEIAELQIGSFRFLLQKFYVAEHAGNFMMALNVEDAGACGITSSKRKLRRNTLASCASPHRCSPGECVCFI